MSAYTGIVRQHRGTAGIKLAFAFISATLLYIIIGYSLPLLLNSTYQTLSMEALREPASLKHSSLPLTAIQQQARQAIEDSWLPAAWGQTCFGYEDEYLKIKPTSAGSWTWSACIRHDNPSSILPPYPCSAWT